MWARLEADRIVEVTALDPAGRYPSELIWTPVPASLSPWIEPGWRIEGERLTPQSLELLRRQIAASAALKRYQAEESGVTVALTQGRTEPATVRIDTSRAARANLLGAAEDQEALLAAALHIETGWPA